MTFVQEAASLIIIIEKFRFFAYLAFHAPKQCRETDLTLKCISSWL